METQRMIKKVDKIPVELRSLTFPKRFNTHPIIPKRNITLIPVRRKTELFIIQSTIFNRDKLRYAQIK